MNLKITLYLDVVSSWCYWAAPAWARLQECYEGAPVDFDWKIALIDATGTPKSREQAEWFYRRSGTVVKSPFRLSSAWMQPGVKQYLAPNCVAEAARDLGATHDEVWMTLADAALHDGKKVGEWEVAAAIAAKAAKLNARKLLEHAQSAEIKERVAASTAEFHAFNINQRPAVVMTSHLGDRAVFSGFWQPDPLLAAVDAMLTDARAYASWKAHFGDPPGA